MVEKILRFRKVSSNKFGDTVITEACILPSKVTHLVIRKPSKFHFKPGDYIYINIPIVAKYEWHPFSISSAPENSDYIWLHIKTCGNWTKRLYNFSSSARFDANISAANLSNIRCNMRTRMSINIINDSNIFAKSSILQKIRMAADKDVKNNTVDNQNETNNNFSCKLRNKKAVSFVSKQESETILENDEINHKINSNKENHAEQKAVRLQNIEEEENPNVNFVVPPVRHKGRLIETTF
jgi:hypothetical protein